MNTSEFEDAKSILIEKMCQLMRRGGASSADHIIRVEQPVASVDPLRWLHQQEVDTKIYWSERDLPFEMAGVGCADVIAGDAFDSYDSIFKKMRSNLNLESGSIRYYGGFCFDQRRERDSIWQDFGAYKFIVPQVEVVHESGETKLAFNFRLNPPLNALEDFIPETLRRIEYHPEISFARQAPLESRRDVPDQKGWFVNIERAKDLFRQNELQKIVLARMSILEFSGSPVGTDLMDKLKSNSPKAFSFYFQPTAETAFLGASPELLYRREKQHLFSEAVAGTCRRGKNEDEDKQLAEELLNSPKDVHEHALVCQAIVEALRRVCVDFTMDDQVSVIRAENVQHLYKKFQGVLREGSSDAEILAALHPTPAVGGVPKEAALRQIRNTEGFDRVWYAAPVGWISADAAEFAVGIRSALIRQYKMHVFAGAGILPDSDPEREWQEIEQKSRRFLNLFEDSGNE